MLRTCLKSKRCSQVSAIDTAKLRAEGKNYRNQRRSDAITNSNLFYKYLEKEGDNLSFTTRQMFSRVVPFRKLALHQIKMARTPIQQDACVIRLGEPFINPTVVRDLLAQKTNISRYAIQKLKAGFEQRDTHSNEQSEDEHHHRRLQSHQ
ncbi:10496_t:CDS:2 [Paraglomus brasilianum]|uniref:10496_t:CDS:1 n=1 Tax=Paraglomus brasilianum TaxID=144538 RepID=A0A9N9CPM9_9GLOM|nr:10496_t:CDS:2 [Paraglomus brasilianum]